MQSIQQTQCYVQFHFVHFSITRHSKVTETMQQNAMPCNITHCSLLTYIHSLWQLVCFHFVFLFLLHISYLVSSLIIDLLNAGTFEQRKTSLPLPSEDICWGNNSNATVFSGTRTVIFF